jgi:signal peptidase I
MEPKKRSPYIAALLSLLSTGLGQMYNGQMIKGIVFCLLGPILGLIALIIMLHNYVGLIVYYVINLLIHLVSIIEAPIASNKLKEITLTRYNRWYYYLLFAVVAAAIMAGATYTLREGYGLKPYTAPSAGMSPAIQPGDRFEVDSNYYKHNPPRRGDVVVFAYPLDRTRIFIKRIVALAGDKVSYSSQAVFVNNMPVPGIPGSSMQGLSGQAALYSLTVPQGDVFVVGDNLANSDDSRNYGPITIGDLRGKALYIYSSSNRSRIGAGL